MKKLIQAVFILSLLISSQAAVFIESLPSISGHENECYDPTEKTFHKPGENMRWRKGECANKVCGGFYQDGRTFSYIYTCGKIGLSPNCYLDVNLELPYPDCCGKVICTSESTNSTRGTFDSLFSSWFQSENKLK